MQVSIIYTQKNYTYQILNLLLAGKREEAEIIQAKLTKLSSYKKPQKLSETDRFKELKQRFLKNQTNIISQSCHLAIISQDLVH